MPDTKKIVTVDNLDRFKNKLPSWYYTRTQVDAMLLDKQGVLVFDNTPTHGSENAVNSGAIADAIENAKTPIATDNTAGKVKPDGTTVTIDQDGTIHSVGGAAQVQADWEQTDTTAVDYIKNKPNVSEKIQYDILPTPTIDLVGKTYQYTGNSTPDYTNGWFYKCVPGETAGTYKWEEVELYRQASDTTLGVVKPDGVSIVMDPDGTIHAMSGGKIRLGNVSGASVTSDKRVVSIRWTDPEDVIQGGITFAKWAGTKIMKKIGSAPIDLDDEDATLLIDSTTRNAYSSIALTDSNVEYGETYYYKFFPYSEDEAVTSGSCLIATPTKIVIENVPTQNGTLAYNGEPQTPSWTGYNSDALALDVTAQTNVGSYTATFTPNADYIWWDGTITAKTAAWSINNIVISAVPTQSGTLSYTGSVQTPTWNGYDTDELAISGDTSGTAVGTYTVTFTPKTNYEWYDGTTISKTAEWEIGEAIITTVPTQQGTLTYNGTEQTAVWNNFDVNQLTIENGTGTNAGTYTASFTPKSGYKWSDGTTTAKTADFVINKAEGSITLSTYSVTLDDNHLTASVTVFDSTGEIISVVSSDTTIATVNYVNNNITINSQSKRGNTVITVGAEASTNYNSTTTNIDVFGDFLAIKDWKDGENKATDEELVAMLTAADAGTLDLNLYWAVGDERTVHLSAMTAGNGLNTAQPEQDVVLVLMDTGAHSGYKDVNNKTVNFVWGQENCLSEYGRMNTSNTNSGSWNGCAMRTDLNNKYYNALPTEFRTCLKQFKTITAQTYNGSTNQTSQDYISLFAEKEIFGSVTYSNSTEASALTQIEYYKTTANRIKQVKGSAYYWWERSPFSGYANAFCSVDSSGIASGYSASTARGIAPFGCI